MTRYIHIGYPKNLSTTLQRDFFSQHPLIHHLGVGVGSNIDYASDELNLVMENYVLYATDRKYRQVEAFSKKVLTEALNVQVEGKQAVGISGELLSFKFSPDHVDSETKARRLAELFDGDAKIIMLIRNQRDLLRSLYREVIKIGYGESFQDFIEYVVYYQDRNFAFDFDYASTVELYRNLFGSENVEVLPVENVRNSDGGLTINEDGQMELTRWLCQALDLPYHELKLEHHNEPLSSKALYQKMMFNRTAPHDLGLPMYSAVNAHRNIKYFNMDLEMPLPKKIHTGLMNKRASIDEAISKTSHSEAVFRGIDYFADPFLLEKLFKAYRASNTRLSELGVTLPEAYSLDKV